jgi:phosphatidylglycerol:prolipoprotein diacylglycerol transferase
MPVHPTFLYESVADLIIFIILLQVRKKSTHAFETSCTYFVLYGAVRFFIEGLRTDSLYIAGTQIRASQALSLFLLLFGLFYIAFAHLKGWERKPFPAKLFAEAAPVREASKAETEEDSKKESEEGSSEAEDAGEEADKDEEVEEKTKDSKDSKAED